MVVPTVYTLYRAIHNECSLAHRISFMVIKPLIPPLLPPPPPQHIEGAEPAQDKQTRPPHYTTICPRELSTQPQSMVNTELVYWRSG